MAKTKPAIKCEVCQEKQTEIERILEAYQKDKKFWFKIVGFSNGLWLIIILFFMSGQFTKLLDLIIEVMRSYLL